MKDFYVPVAVHKGRLRMSDVIDRMHDRGSLGKETIATIINSFHETAMELAADGYNVDAGLVYLRAMITGTNSSHEIDQKVNKVVISACYGGNSTLLKKPKTYEFALPVVIHPKL